jgi:hypothetical protein
MVEDVLTNNGDEHYQVSYFILFALNIYLDCDALPTRRAAKHTAKYTDRQRRMMRVSAKISFICLSAGRSQDNDKKERV